MSQVRVGLGFDAHRLGGTPPLILGGVVVDPERGLEATSDGDAAAHALSDALLGTIGDGDIGQHFPPSDPKWKGASSDVFLADAVRRVAERGGRIVNLDVTIVCEAPSIAPHRQKMQARVAEIAGVTPDRVGIKATTNEKMGFVGRGEGIVAMAMATVALPRNA